MSWKIDPGAVGGIFANADTDISEIKNQHKKVSTTTDDAEKVFTDPKCNPIEAALAKAYNRVMSHAMANAEAHSDALLDGGRKAVDAYNKGQEDMAKEFERNASNIPEQHIFDGKAVPK